MDNQRQGQPRQIQVKASDEVLKGVYSTNMQVAHGKEEFILDFMNLFPPQATLVSRIIVSPPHFKRMVKALVDNLKKYEERFGKVEIAEQENKEIGFKIS